MLKKILFLSLFGVQAIAQTSVPNLDFESWVLSTSTRYEDPTPTAIWATPNYAMDLILGNPSTSIVQKSTSSHGGSFAALMKSRTIVGSFVGATLFTGSLDITVPFSPVPKLGIAFAGRPISMKGWYKYAPVNNDSSSIYLKLTKWNSTTNTRDVVGFIEKRDYTSVANYTPFDMPIVYSSTAIPDSVTIVFSASAGAEQNKGEVGSSLWIDDVLLNYSPTSMAPTRFTNNSINIYPNPCIDLLNIQCDFEIDAYSIYSVTGKLIQSNKMNIHQENISIQALPHANYLIHFINSQHQFVGSCTFTKL
jgi:hypothetical protein